MLLPDPRERPTLSVEEAGRFLGLGRSAAYQAVRRGELPSITFGRRVVCPTAAIRRLLQIDPVPIRDDAPAVEAEAHVFSISGGTRHDHSTP